MNITKKLMIAAGLFIQLSSLHAGDAEWLAAFNAFGGADKVKAKSMDSGDARAKAKKAGDTNEMQAVALFVSKKQDAIVKSMFPKGTPLLNQVAPALAAANALAASAVAKSAMDAYPAAAASPTKAVSSKFVNLATQAAQSLENAIRVAPANEQAAVQDAVSEVLLHSVGNAKRSSSSNHNLGRMSSKKTSKRQK